MKQFLSFTSFLLLMMLSISACAPDAKQKNSITVNRDADLLPPMEIAIAPAIKDNPELVDMVQSSEKAINQFSDNIERLADDAKVLLEKQEGEQSLGDGLRVAKIMMSFASNSSDITATIKKFETYMETQKSQGEITDEQIEALDKVGEAFAGRMKQLGEKYKDILDNAK